MMRFAFSNKIKAVVSFKPVMPWLRDSHSHTRFQLMCLFLANRVKAVVAFKLHGHCLADSYLVLRFQMMRILC